MQQEKEYTFFLFSGFALFSDQKLKTSPQVQSIWHFLCQHCQRRWSTEFVMEHTAESLAGKVHFPIPSHRLMMRKPTDPNP